MKRNLDKMDQRRCGLTLIELLAVVTVMGILAMIAAPRFVGSSEQAKQAACNTNKANIEVQAQLWFRNKGTWPLGSMSNMMADGDYFPDGVITCPFDGSSYEFNATSQRVNAHTH